MAPMKLTMTEAKRFKLFGPIAEYIQGRHMKIVKIKLNSSQIFAITDDDNILASGDNSKHMLGCGGVAHLRSAVVDIWAFRGKKIIDIVCGKEHCLALTSYGAVYAWGLNKWGQLGTGNFDSAWKPRLIISSGIKSIQCGHNHSMALTTDGRVLTWGTNKDGRLGNGTKMNAFKPTEVYLARPQKIIQIACSTFHSLLLTDTGRVLSFGSNQFGQLGQPNYKIHAVPTELMLLEDIPIDFIACGTQRSVFRSTDGRLFVCGKFNYSPKPITSNVGEVFVLDKSLYSEHNLIDDVIMMLDSSNSSTQSQTARFWSFEKGRGQIMVDQSTVDVLLKFYGLEAFPELIDIEPETPEETYTVNIELFPKEVEPAKTDPFIEGTVLIDYLSDGRPEIIVTEHETELLIDLRPEAEVTDEPSDQFKPGSNLQVLLDLRPEAEVTDEPSDQFKPGSNLQLLFDLQTEANSNVQLLVGLQPIDTQPDLIPAVASLMEAPLTKGLALLLEEVENQTEDELSPAPDLATKLAKLFDNPLGSDITFHWSSGDYIHAHRIVLSNASAKLAKLLEDGAWTGSVVMITHYTFMAFYQYLRYIYTHQFDDTLPVDRLLNLMIISHYFEQADLKDKCATVIKANISESTCCRLYHVAIKHDLVELELSARAFISKHLHVVMHTEDYKLLPDEEKGDLLKFRALINLEDDSIADESEPRDNSSSSAASDVSGTL